MQKYYFSEGLIGAEWAKDICLTVAPDGMISEIETDHIAPAGAVVFGPVLPAMANLHSHAFQRGFAGLAEYKSPGKSDFWSWREAMYGFANHMSPAVTEVIASALYVEMLKAGYSAVGEFHYLHNSHIDQSLAMSDAILTAADKTGISLTHLPVFYEASDFGGKPAGAAQEPFLHTVDEFTRLLQILAPRFGGQHRLGVAFHSLRAVKETSFAPVIDCLEKISLTAPIHIHIAEQIREVEACIDYCGKRPIEWLLDALDVDQRWCLVHATHLLEHEWRGVSESGAVVGLCPTTEANLGDGLFPMSEYLKHDGAWGIGSDSHISVDAREELRLLEYGQRLARQERTVLTAREGGHCGEFLWQAAALGGAQALAQPIGEISTGKRADVVVLDASAPAFAGASYSQILDAYIFAGQPNPISDVMVAGEWVVQAGKHKNEDAIFERYRETVSEIVAKQGLN